ncbi:MAG: hypothetical protein M3454_10395, partial [Actinomycetota bacterium]|nr:hypothetical protein [Actinomycetota bacterium]
MALQSGMQSVRTIAWRRSGGRKGRTLQVAVLALALVASLVPVGGALAQADSQVTALAVEQQHGFSTLSWDPVEGATDYQ